jgi:hypothetical protein
MKKGKAITCPVKRWPGTIVIAHPMTLPQVALFQRMWRELGELGDVSSLEQSAVLWPGLRELILEWNIKNLDLPSPDNFPGQPTKDVDEFFVWLFKEVLDAYQKAEGKESPKAP